MRLLQTSRLELHQFFDDKIPKYAILSHRWGDDEISYQDWQADKKKAGGGLSKITRCCERAKSDGLAWAWIDTVCIDKTSSAELSEAINSMYRWYANAEVCYAYLPDVQLSQEDWFISFKESEWWTRGWTLQELLAPRELSFFDRDWTFLGTKRALPREISRMTGIDIPNLAFNFDQISIATKMSWVAKRKTSRIEDMAYCMLGIFDVNMPLLYGEGKKAFFRLQQEIIKTTDDESIFAWTSDRIYSGMFAPWPDCFAESNNIVRCKSTDRPPYAMTSKGLALPVPAAYHSEQGSRDRPHTIGRSLSGDGLCIALELNCRRTGDARPLEIRLIKRGDGWYRRDCAELKWYKTWLPEAGLSAYPRMATVYVSPLKAPSIT